MHAWDGMDGMGCMHGMDACMHGMDGMGWDGSIDRSIDGSMDRWQVAEVAPGKPPALPVLSDSFEVMAEGDFSAKDYSVTIFEAFDYPNNRRLQRIVRNGTAMGYDLYDYWNVGIQIKLERPTADGLDNVPCKATKLRDGGFNDDGAYVVMACVVMAHVIMAYVVMAYVVMAHVVMACVVMT